MSNTNLNPETAVFTEATLKKQLEAIYQHLGTDAKKQVDKTVKKIMTLNKSSLGN